MKSFVPAALAGAVMTAAAIGFGAATAHATHDHTSQPTAQVVHILQNVD